MSTMIIKGGRVIDSANGRDEVADIVIANGKIAQKPAVSGHKSEEIDAEGLIVAPGLIETEMTANLDGRLLEAVPARRVGKPQDVAACVRFLASEQAGYVTGAVLTVDGGLAA